ncbi:hypothetical protein [Tsukamurella pulmonis]|uniref:hypothetical protein n=1 Tax=Tsukamurella pulmonis TaxID=47312 RepID=UPI000E08DBDD|nr:hypothetical protein [Tsukamurella pulmonis]RDH12026.1 hypothetical protein DVB88_09640 [Tsukamurella pulmonis]
MPEPTDPQPTDPQPAAAQPPTAPIPPVVEAAPTGPPPAAPAPAAAPSGGPSRKLLIGAIVFGLIGFSGVSFTAGYWVSELGDHRGGHAMERTGPGGHGAQARLFELHREGGRAERMRPPGLDPSEPTAGRTTADPSGAPSTPTPAPAP